MKQKGKFLLLDVAEFSVWLSGLIVHRAINVIQIHHTFLPDYKSFRKAPDHIHWMESMEASHKERGFTQIAQQLTTFPDGMICIGRPFDDVPAGIKGANQHGICIENLGNFNNDGDEMTEDHKRTIVRITAELCKKFSLIVNTDHVVYHHWYDLDRAVRTEEGTGNTKTCPGERFFGGNTTEACQTNFLPLVAKILN